jgi:hypothetical protein
MTGRGMGIMGIMFLDVSFFWPCFFFSACLKGVFFLFLFLKRKRRGEMEKKEKRKQENKTDSAYKTTGKDDSLQRAMDSPCYVNCPTLKTQSMTAMNKCHVKLNFEEPIDGCTSPQPPAVARPCRT